MRSFLDEDFLLLSGTARALYHDYAASVPIIDYHNHLSPGQIANDVQFENITRAWLAGDHYKWRAMRANGIDEQYISGDASDFEKFEKWAATVPFTARNPLFHWTHLELRNPFQIKEILNPGSAISIYHRTSEQLRSQWSVKQLLRHYRVRALCTTDDPIDDLAFHRRIREENFECKVLPTFRPDRAMSIDDVAEFNRYLDLLAGTTHGDIGSWNQFLEAMTKRHRFFAENGCKLSDHGLETFYSEDFTTSEITRIFRTLRSGKSVSRSDQLKFKSACLLEFARWDAEAGWVQQFHVGAIRNNSPRLMARLGKDTGADSIGDFPAAEAMARFFSSLESENKLAKTIVYNLNPAYNEVFATMAANFNDGAAPGKMQYGAAWWFLDQKEGIEKQLNVISNMGLLSRFVGMLTDSRSFLSFSRHEYFRRILCNVIGQDIENGELPADLPWLGSMVRDICYGNAERYFGF